MQAVRHGGKFKLIAYICDFETEKWIIVLFVSVHSCTIYFSAPITFPLKILQKIPSCSLLAIKKLTNRSYKKKPKLAINPGPLPPHNARTRVKHCTNQPNEFVRMSGDFNDTQGVFVTGDPGTLRASCGNGGESFETFLMMAFLLIDTDVSEGLHAWQLWNDTSSLQTYP